MTIYKGTDLIAGVPDLNSKANNADVVHLAGTETISGNKKFTGMTIFDRPISAGSSDLSGDVVTTEGINKSENGYVKLGNGMIIQWGRFTNTNNTFSVTLPTPFTTNNYSIAYGCLDSQRSGDNTITTNTTSTTGFTGWISCHSTNLQSQWIAIGY